MIIVLLNSALLRTVMTLLEPMDCDPLPTKTYLDFDAADYDSINLLISSHPFQFQSSDNLPTDPNDLWDAFV